MLDLKFIRNNKELVAQAIANKNESVDIEYLLSLDEKKRKLQFDFDTLRHNQNKVSKEIAQLKKNKQDASDLLAEMKKIASKLKKMSANISKLNEDLKYQLLKVPNVPDKDVPVGKDESANEIISYWGEKPEYDFELKDHIQLANINNLLDFKRATKLSGSGFAGYYDKGASLERSIINFMLDYHLNFHGYKEVSLPFIVSRKTMTGTGQLPKLENDMYHIEQDDMFLIPTAEVSVTNFYSEEILPSDILPIKFVSYSPCFRREAGSYGKETRGLQRLHQFNKVEMVRFVKPEQSEKALDEMVQNAADILQELGLHYRIVKLATGDLSFASAKTYDLELWSPGSKKWLEVSSVSNFRDFQARRASIRFRDNDGKVKFVHTLNGSGVATPRLYIALLETYQTKEGKIKFPEKVKKLLQLKIDM